MYGQKMLLRSGDVMTDDVVTGCVIADVAGKTDDDWSGLKLDPTELLFVLGTETLPDVLA